MAIKYTGQAQQQPAEQTQEGSFGYGIRNAARQAPNIISTVRSGLGATNILSSYLEEAGAPEWVKALQQHYLPSAEQSHGQINQGIQNVLNLPTSSLMDFINPDAAKGMRQFNKQVADYFTDTREGDYPADVLSTLGIGAGAGFAAGGPPGALMGLASAGTAMAGSKVLGDVGEWAGDKVGESGYPKTGKATGEFLGNLLGIFGPEAAYNKGVKYVESKKLPPQIKAAEALNEHKRVTGLKSDVEQLKNKHLTENEQFAKEQHGATADIEGRHFGELSALEKEHGKQVTEHEHAVRESRLDIPREKAKFFEENAKKQQGIQEQIDAKQVEIEQLQAKKSEYYDAARELYKGEKGSISDLTDVLQDVKEHVGGMDSAEQTRINRAITDIDNKIREGQMTVRDASELYHSINSQKINHTNTPLARGKFGRLTQALDKFVKKHASPEYYEKWDAGNKVTREVAIEKGIEPRGKRGPKAVTNLDELKQQLKAAEGEQFNPTQETALKEKVSAHEQALAELKRDQKVDKTALENKHAREKTSHKEDQQYAKQAKERVQQAAEDKLDNFTKDELGKTLETFDGEMKERAANGEITASSVLGWAAYVSYLGPLKSAAAAGFGALNKFTGQQKRIIDYAFSHHPEIARDFTRAVEARKSGNTATAFKLVDHAGKVISQYLPLDKAMSSTGLKKSD